MELELKKAIKESGNNLHLKVAELLKHLGWNVDISPYYCDDFTDKPREIDIIATRKIPIFIDPGPENSEHWFNVVLYVECKKFIGDVNFRVFDNDKSLSRAILCNQSLNLYIERIFDENSLLENHHYLVEPKVAKLYDCPKKRQDDIFQAITQSVKSFIFFKKSGGEGVKGSICYPMVIYDGIDGIYIMSENNTDEEYLDKLKKEKRAIFYLKYSYPETIFSVPGIRYSTKDFYVDFIHKDELENFLIDIEKNEIDKIKPFLRHINNNK